MTIETRISEMEERFKRFRIEGAGMTLEGSVFHGYACNCPTCPEDDPNSECGGGPTPPTDTCPADEGDVNVLLAGIVNNGCVSFPSFGSFTVNGDPNGSYVLVNDSPGHWTVELTGVFTLDRYASDVSCTSFIRTDDMSLFVTVLCQKDTGINGIDVSSFLKVGTSTFCNVFHSFSSDVGQRSFTNDFPLDGFFDFGTATIST